MNSYAWIFFHWNLTKAKLKPFWPLPITLPNTPLLYQLLTKRQKLWQNVFVPYGIPRKIHNGQGPDLESRTFKELCALTGIQKGRATPYHPRSNPVERFNRTPLDRLGTLSEQEKGHWKDFAKPLVHAYNCTRNDTTGSAPYELMFGGQPRLPVDLAFGLPLSPNPAAIIRST